MVAHDEMLDTAVAHELHAGRIDEEIALLVSGARYECRVSPDSQDSATSIQRGK
jgi:hypothetical protein